MKNIAFLFLLVSIIFHSITAVAANSQTSRNQSFPASKKLMKRVYYDNQQDFYCGCAYNYLQIKGRERTVVDPDSCGYVPRQNSQRG